MVVIERGVIGHKGGIWVKYWAKTRFTQYSLLTFAQGLVLVNERTGAMTARKEHY